ncbi:peptide transporter family 1 isoform X2 [Halyomorpha halys]|uniref:peptide transporter family 1 isoform X2 n=1 Tax=Halyomorpha halys TaxID=286706 RepID=UPI0034D3632D
MEEARNDEVNLKYPKQVIFVCFYELLERFTFYSIRTILVLYFSDVLNMTEDEATVYFHSFIIIAYLLPLFGGWIADSFLGKFRTIIYMSCVYATGVVILTCSSLAPQLSVPGKPFCLIGMVFIAVGTGILKPCVVPFGADQFTLPGQNHELNEFFSLFYWCINVGSVVACFASPFIRSNVQCFGNTHCYSLAFTTSTCTIVLALTIIAIGKKWYIIEEAHHNVVSQFFGCLGYGLWRKFKSHDHRRHWLDHADDKFSHELIEDSKIIVRIFTVISPAIVFWALNDKQSSRWTFQARQLNGQIVDWFRIEPDQMSTSSSLLVLVAVPLFQKIIYPAVGKIGLCKSLLCRMSIGGFLMCVTFLIAALLQSKLELNKSESQLSIAWQLPQYVVLVCAEILFVISGTNFAYTQALEFIVDSCIMAFFMTIFSFLAYRFLRSEMIRFDYSDGITESQRTITSRT